MKVEPAVVQVFASGYRTVPTPVGPTLQKQRGIGSGLFVRADGYVLTNAHVVQGAKKVFVGLARRRLPSGRSLLDPKGDLLVATIVGIDQETDLALLKVEGTDFPVLPFGDSETLGTGEIVLAFGAPRGLEGSVSMGVVSTVARQLRPEAPMVYIQTDAPINPGNSGGPMVNTKGEVVGINTLILSESGGSEGLGFAVPSHIAKTIYEQLRTHGRVRRGVIGARTQTIDAVLAAGLGLPRSWGVIVSDILPSSPAAAAGLRPGDVIVSLNGKVMENARQFDVNVYHQPFGEPVDLTISRGGAAKQISVQVIERPAILDGAGVSVDPKMNLVERLGVLAVSVNDLPEPLQRRLRRQAGVAVVVGAPGTTASAGLRPGDVIHALNRTLIDGVDDLNEKLGDLDNGDAVAMQVERSGRLLFLPFLME